jgi:nitrogen fixation NifU-like protein
MKDALKLLYNKLILDRQKDPTGFEKRKNAHNVIDAYNPVCGDQFKIYLDLEGGNITKVSYYGYGCALSKAATSLLIEGLADKSVDDCKKFIEYYFQILDNNDGESPEIYKALAMAKEFPGRKQCTTLSWEAVSKFLKDK